MIKQGVKLKDMAQNFYMCFMVVYMIVREVVPLHFLIDNIILSTFIFMAGFLLILWDLLTDRDCLKGRAIDFFAAFLLISVISSIINYKYGVTANIKCIAAMVLCYFVFFPMGLKKDTKKTLHLMLNTLIITLFIFVIISIGMYLFTIDYTVESDVLSGVQGFNTTWGRLWGVLSDPNANSYIALVSVFASGYFMFAYKKIWAYVLYGINIFVLMSFIVLSLSRSAYLVMLIMPVVSAVYLFLAYIKTNKKRAICSVAFMAAVSVVLCGFYFGLKKGMPYVKTALLNAVGVQGREKVVTAYDRMYQACGMKILNIDKNHIVQGGDNDIDIIIEVEEIDRKDQKDDYSNGRFDRWQAGIEVFKTTPIIGTSPRNDIAMAKDRTPETGKAKYDWVTHCSYLDLLVNTGVLGFAVMMGCLLYLAILFLKAAVKKGFDIQVFIAFLCYISVAAGIFFISDVFFLFTINALIFFYLLGYLYNYIGVLSEGILYKCFAFITGRDKSKE